MSYKTKPNQTKPNHLREIELFEIKGLDRLTFLIEFLIIHSYTWNHLTAWILKISLQI